MTPDEWRERYKCCANCVYCCNKKSDDILVDGFCTVKKQHKMSTLIRFCKVYKAQKYELQEEKPNDRV